MSSIEVPLYPRFMKARAAARRISSRPSAPGPDRASSTGASSTAFRFATFISYSVGWKGRAPSARHADEHVLDLEELVESGLPPFAAVAAQAVAAARRPRWEGGEAVDPYGPRPQARRHPVDGVDVLGAQVGGETV